MKKLSMIDKGFLFQESREMPMHVGGVNLYTLPDGADGRSPTNTPSLAKLPGLEIDGPG